NNTKVSGSEIEVRVNHARLAQYGIEVGEVLAVLQAARLGVEATRIVRQKEDIAVLVKMDTDGLSDLDSITKLPLMTAGGETVLLERLADVKIGHTAAAITRLNGQREITLIAEVEGAIPAVVSRLREKFKVVQPPEGYSIDFTGQYEVLLKVALDMLVAVAAAMILVYFIMAMQFGSWFQPLIILITIPLSLAGALVALFVTHHGLDVSVGMGAVTLVGMAVNNAIVLIDYANRRTAAGSAIREAVLEAASVRLRPILLTTFTTISALLPVAIGTTVGSRIFQPFAVTVIGGLASGVLATLIIVPTLMTSLPGSGRRAQ
ncbi:MAG: MMPL family transporter, partial [Nitrospiraceae bacterium]|nr:MMPL family transporter [Nitrospiraceae bacterium]